MDKIFILLFFACFLTEAWGQSKEDHIWLFGRKSDSPLPEYGGSQMDFNKTPAEVTRFDIPLGLEATTMMSDSQGQLLFYSNGCQVMNRHHRQMPNGHNINEGKFATHYCKNDGYPPGNGIIALPVGEHLYYLFHLRVMTLADWELLYSKIDMRLDNGNGDVAEKNMFVFGDTIGNYLTAVRHGNGRDWWIITHKRPGNTIYTVLLDPTGVHGPYRQNIGHKWSERDSGGQSVFSPDGRYYARVNSVNGVSLFDFDRCSGRFSNARRIRIDSTVNAAGVAFSSTSRYLYISNAIWYYQYDMQAADIGASRILIDTFDGFLGPLYTTFYHQRLGPDNKIYMTAASGVNYLHVTHAPDLPGRQCDFRQHDVRLPTYHSFTTPNFPFLRLYAAKGSPCDTLKSVGTGTAFRPPLLTLRPNPATDHLSAHFSQSFTGILHLCDLTGRIIQTHPLERVADHVLNTQGLAGGIYYLSGLNRLTGERIREKVVVMAE